jgi:putative PIN family toxin of toxin-antitoxin system
MRLVIDTNIWISALISPPFYRYIKNIITSKNVKIFCSEILFEEIKDTAKKSKLLKYFTPRDADDLVQQLYYISEIIVVQSVIEICRDPKDNFLLALAKDGNADYLITGDKDLLVLKKYGKTKIITINELEQIMNHKDKFNNIFNLTKQDNQ